MKKKENLFIHDYIQNYGGGERLILSLIEKKDTLLTSFIDKNCKKLLHNKKKIILLKNKYINDKIKKFLTPISFYLYKSKKNYKNFIVSGNYSVFINLPKKSNKIFYCHSLPKLFFEFEKFYNKNNFFLKLFVLLTRNIFRYFYIKKINCFNKVVTNSKYTKLKLKKYYKKKIHVIYPPIKNYRIIKNKKDKIFFLSNNRHELEKNIDTVIRVFNRINKYNLIILSKGSQTNYLKKLAKENKRIKFFGMVSEIKYKKLINECIATINISKNEDFGMAAIEGMTAGKPALVVNDGGYKETCKNNYNSFVINKNNLEKNFFNFLNNIKLKEFKKMKKNCIETSKKFNSKIFNQKIKKLYI